ncbi:unnamed protein product [Tilletia laevis]|nr:unnamed protein product [Tilletia laevis]
MSHRRSTVGPPDQGAGPSGSGSGSGSNIPIPASAHKSQSSSSSAHGPPVSSQHSALRASRTSSLVPSRSQDGPLSSQGAAERSIVGAAGGSGGLGSSIGPGGGGGAGRAGASTRTYSEEALTTPRAGTSVRGVGSSQMRQSTASAGVGRQSLAVQSTPNQQRVFGRQSVAHGSRPEPAAMKDPRPLRNANFRAGMEANIKDYVEKTGFTMAGWTNKTIHEPTQQAFVNMFRHIYSHLFDTDYVFGSEAKKFEEEVIMLMKDAKYPFVDDLSKTRLTSAGSQQNWPICLGMLDWMVRLGLHAAELGRGPLQREEEEGGDEIFFRYLWRCYAKFWQGEDQFPEENDELRAIYDERNEAGRAEMAELDKSIARMHAQIAELEKESPLQHEEREAELLQSDIAKFSRYNEEVLEPRLQKSARAVEKLKQDNIELEENVKEIEKEKARLQAIVDAQDMSAEEFERLTGEREHIQKQLVEASRVIQTVTKSNWAIELQLQKRQAAVETLMSAFNEIGERVKFLPLTSADGLELDKLELVPANEDTLLPKGLDIKRDIKPAIVGLRHATNATFKSVSDAKLALEEEEENLVEQLTAMRAQIREEEGRLAALKDQIDELTSNSGIEMDMLAQEYARKERQLTSVESAGRVALQEANMTYDAMVDELTTAQTAIEENKQRMMAEIQNALGELERMKQRVHEGIERIEEAVLVMDGEE